MTLTLIRLAQVDSTQSFLARHPELGHCAVMADEQTTGRGRGGNRWESALGAGLWLSKRMRIPELPPGLVLQRAMLLVAAALAPSGLQFGLKWPNDLVAWKQNQLVKLGGIIGESAGGNLLLGLGVNLQAAPMIPERAIPPASLQELGATWIPDTQELALKILEAWNDLSVSMEAKFRWPVEGDALRWEEGQGLCLGWEPDGRLRVATMSGEQRLSAGDVNSLR